MVQWEEKKRQASQMHGDKTKAFLAADTIISTLGKKNKSGIASVQPYFDCRATHDRDLTGLVEWQPGGVWAFLYLLKTPFPQI
jgi:hypothetical protein